MLASQKDASLKTDGSRDEDVKVDVWLLEDRQN